jgi:hypothetical protein
MASKFISKVTFSALILVLCLAALPTPAFASGPIDSSPLKIHTIKFYLDPALLTDMEYAKTVLPKYVADMNTILAKNTNRRFEFDPETGIIATDKKPQTDSGRPPMPTEGFEIWAHAVWTGQASSYGGYAGMDLSGAGVLAGMRWTRLYDPDALQTADVLDYSIQIDHMLHEFGHVLGAGIGEYYSLAYIKDTTNTTPLLDINLNTPGDPFWSDKPDFMKDPILRPTRATSREEYLSLAQFSDLTATIINGSYRNGVPSFEQFTIQVLDENGLPVSNANVKVWNVQGVSPFVSQLVTDGLTDENGQIVIPWGAPTYSHNANNLLRLIKVYRDGVSVTEPRYVSIFDADIASLVKQSSSQLITFNLTPALNKNNVETFTSIGANDDWVLESGENTNAGGMMDATAATFRLGDNATRDQYRGILSFDTSSLPDNATITKATLKVRRQGVNGGGNPVSLFKGFMVDLHKGSFGTPAPQTTDWQASGNKTLGPFNSSPSNGWYSLDLTGANAYINKVTTGGGLTEVRLRFKLDDNNDAVANFLSLYSGDASAASRPQLVIEYSIP